MSPSPPARSPQPKSQGGTKQLLEELDALMQRMLAVPVNDIGEVRETEEDAPQVTETAKTSPDSEAPSPAKPQIEQETPAPARPQAPPSATTVVTAHEAAPTLAPPHLDLRMDQVDTPTRDITDAPPPGAVPLGGFWPHPALQGPQWREAAAQRPTAPPHWSPSSQSRTAQSPVRPVAASRRPIKDWWLHSLLWSNRTYDRCTVWLGRPGRWLQGPTGRMLLGLLGIGLLAGSVAWGLSNWFDWTW